MDCSRFYGKRRVREISESSSESQNESDNGLDELAQFAAKAKDSPDADNKNKGKKRATRSSSVAFDVTTTSVGASPDDEGACLPKSAPKVAISSRGRNPKAKSRPIPEEEESQPPATVVSCDVPKPVPTELERMRKAGDELRRFLCTDTNKGGLLKIDQSLTEILNARTHEKAEIVAVDDSVQFIQPLNDVWKFTVIASEEELINFEKKIDSDASFLLKCIQDFIENIDNQHTSAGKKCYDCALLLDRHIFTNAFWSQTAWTGELSTRKQQFTTNDTENDIQEKDDESIENVSGKKFTFSKHKAPVCFERLVEAFKRRL
ncbi:hypothetical protein FQR65_LT15664 [Abscondita terminalis]|nr:hypothetical protein FQR65_LT15664 [Abscondita terminalis]